MRCNRKSVANLAAGMLAVAALPLLLMPSPAAAQRRDVLRGIGVGAGVAIGAGIINEIARGANAATEQRPRSGNSSGGGRKQKSKDEGSEEAKAAATKKIQTAAKTQTTDMSASERYELLERDRVRREDRQRNVDHHIDEFLDTLRLYHAFRRAEQKREEAVKISSEVTQADVRRTLEEAYEGEQLAQFSEFEGEPWSRDRIMVRVLQEAGSEVAPYFKGVGSRGPNAGDIAVILRKAANRVYGQIFELSEMLGMASSHERMNREVAERGNPEQSERVLEVLAGTGFDRAVADTLQPSHTRRLEGVDSFAFRLRARRALYDCVSADIWSSGAGAQPLQGAPKMEIRADAPAGFQRTSSGADKDKAEQGSTVKIVEEAATVASTGEMDVKGLIGKACNARLTRLQGTKLMPVPAKAMLDGETRPIVDGQIWRASMSQPK